MTYLNSRDLLQLQHDKCSFSEGKEFKIMKKKNCMMPETKDQANSKIQYKTGL
jgi:hypothetical protein